MTHLPYIIPSYSIAILVPLAYGLAAWQRLRRARVRLAALDQRRRR